MLHFESESSDQKWRDGSLITRHVGTSVANTNATKGLILQLPLSDALSHMEITDTTISIGYEVTKKERMNWVGTADKPIDLSSDAFRKSQFPQLIMHHTLTLFLAIPNLSSFDLHYSDPMSSLYFTIDRDDFEAYTPRDIERATTSANRFNRVVIEDYVLVPSRRNSFLERFKTHIQVAP